MYTLDQGAFTRGEIICEYVVGDMQRNSSKFLGKEYISIKNEPLQSGAIEVYQKILLQV